MTTNKKKKLKKEKIKFVKVIESKIKEVKSDVKIIESKDLDKQKTLSNNSQNLEFVNNSKIISQPRLLANINLEKTTSEDLDVISVNNNKNNAVQENIKNYVEKPADYSSVRVVSQNRGDSRQSRIVERSMSNSGQMVNTPPARAERISDQMSSSSVRELDNSPRLSVPRNVPVEPSFATNEPYISDSYIPKYSEISTDNGLGEGFQKDFFMRRRRKDL